MRKPRCEVLGMSELAYNLLYTRGYNTVYTKERSGHPVGSRYDKAFKDGRRAAKPRW